MPTASRLMGVLNKGLKASIKRAIETRFDQFLADLGGQALVEEALDKVVKASSSDFAPKEKEALFALKRLLEDYQRVVADHYSRLPPSLAGAARGEPSVDLKEFATDIVRRQIRGAKADAVPNSVLSSLAEFDDYFAGKEQGRAETLRSKLLIEAGIPVTSEQVRGGVRAIPRLCEAGRFTLCRRRGHWPQAGGWCAARYHGLRMVRGSCVQIRARSLTHRKGRVGRRLGPFAPDTVYRAILYAADGRPMSVTILSSDVFARKVLLHPALEDSRLGCEIIELDRFTFSYIDADTRGAVNKAIARAQVQNDLYTMSVITGRRAHGLLEPATLYDGTWYPVRSKRWRRKSRIPPLFTDAKASTFAGKHSIYWPSALSAIQDCR